MDITQLLIITIVLIVFDWVFLTVVTVIITQRKKLIKEESFFTKVNERLNNLELNFNKDKGKTEGDIIRGVSALLNNKFNDQNLRVNYLSLVNELNDLSKVKNKNEMIKAINKLESKVIILRDNGCWTDELKKEVIQKIDLIISEKESNQELYELMRLEQERINELRMID